MKSTPWRHAAPSGSGAGRWAGRVRLVCCALFVAVAMAPTLRDDYLFSDDYYWYDIQHSRPSAAAWEATMMTVMNGRPVHGALLIASFPLLARRGGWLVLRACGVSLVWLLAWAFSRALRTAWGAAPADWVATSLALLPGFALFAYWLVAMPCLLAAICGALAFTWVVRPAPRARVLGAVALMLGLSIYQPFALVYFALLGFNAALGRPVRTTFAWGTVAVGGYYVLARLCIAGFGFEIAKRGELVFEPSMKAQWLLGSALPFASKLWWIGAPTTPAAAGLCALLGSLAYLVCRRGQLRSAAWIGASALMTVLPHLTVRETVTRFRTLLPLTVLIALLLMAAIADWAGPRLGAWLRLLPGVVACLALVRAHELWCLAVVPERAVLMQAMSELARTRAPHRLGERASLLSGAASQVVLRAGSDAVACVPRLSDDEFTAPSSRHDFAVRGIVRLAHQLSMESLVSSEPPPPTAAAESMQIDLRRVTASACARANRMTPSWGRAPVRTASRTE